MSTDPGSYLSMGQTYSTQQTSLVFTGYSYTYSASTLSIQSTTVAGADCYLQVTANPSSVPINVGDHIVGPNIPVETFVTSILANDIYQVSKSQTQANTIVSAYVATGSPTQYGKIVATAPTYGSVYRGQLSIYVPTSSNSNSLMVLTNGNVAIGQGKTAPLSTFDLSGTALISGNLAIGYGKTSANQGMVLDISGSTNFGGDALLTSVVEKYSNGTVTSNAISITYSAQSNIIAISPSSASNIALTISSVPTSRGTAIYDFTFIISTGTYKQYISTLTVNGSSVTMIAAGGLSAIAVNSSAVAVLQTISVQMNGATVVNAFTNVSSFF